MTYVSVLGSDFMRMIKKIKDNDYFRKLNIPNDVLLDSLTKTLNRKYIMSYITYLINKKIPFSMAIIDIDNFKIFNDTYGHMVGDKIISVIANIICESATDNCMIGRYGGDEFIVVLEGDDTYDEEWKNLKQIFTSVRHPITIDLLTLNVTCTAGCAAFPKDGETLEEIFLKADRTLYRGKMKGRNCFICYVKEKHQNLEYIKEVRLPNRMDKLYDFFKGEQDKYFEIYEALLYMVNDLKTDAAGLFEKDKPPLLYRTDVEHTVNALPDDVLEENYDNDIIIVNMRSNLDVHSRLKAFMAEHNIRSLLISRVKVKSKDLGYIMLYQERYRIWQDDDISLLKYLSTIIGLTLYYTNDEEA